MIPYFLVFLSGLFVGSFLNVVSDRLEKGGSIFFGRSKCDFCGHKLSPKELIPLVSYIIQRGRCSECGEKLSLLYPISELLTGLVFVSVALWLQVFDVTSPLVLVSFAFYLIVSSLLLIIFLSDLKFMIVPDTVVFPAILLVFIYRIGVIALASFNLHSQLAADAFGKYLIEAGFWWNHTKHALTDFGFDLIAAALVFIFFLTLIILTKGRGMGGGDVKLGFLIGLIVGFPKVIVALFSAFLLGALFSIVLVAVRKKTMKEVIPFGPFLIVGMYIALFYGNEIIEWYLTVL